MNSEIWLVHAGCGKTFAAQQRDDVLDFTIGEYKYREPLQGLSLRESEEVKASNGELSSRWPWNYIKAVEQEYYQGRYSYILAPVIFPLAEDLSLEGIPYTVVYPDPSLREEYKERYIQRGNNDAFLGIFIDRWEYWISDFEAMNPPRRIVLQSGEYLSDVLGERLVRPYQISIKCSIASSQLQGEGMRIFSYADADSYSDALLAAVNDLTAEYEKVKGEELARRRSTRSAAQKQEAERLP